MTLHDGNAVGGDHAMQRTLLGRCALHDAMERSIDETGMLDLWFATAHPDSSVVSEDGNRTIAWLGPSGEVAGLLVQDYVNGESRIVPFSFGTVEIANDGSEISVFLITVALQPSGSEIDRRGRLAERPFDVKVTRDKVLVRFRGRLVRTLTGADADEIRAAVAAGDDATVQLLVARKTGNFKRGNER